MSTKLELAMRIRADMKQAMQQLDQLENELDDAGDQAKRTNSDMEKLGATLGKVAAAFAGGVVYKAVIAATVEQERVTKQLEATLRATGGAAGLNRDQLLSMASALQQVTTYGDEAIIPAQSLLLSFKQIGSDVFPRALSMVLDLSTAMQQDLGASATMLGKALEDPVRGITALNRVGATLTEEQGNMVKALAESGRMAEAQTLILEVLEGQYGGSARAARDSFGGAIQGLKNAFGDLLEGKSGLKESSQEIERLTSILADPATAQGADKLVSTLIRLTGALASAAAEGGNFLLFLDRLGTDISDKETEALKTRLDDLQNLLDDKSLFNVGERIRFFGPDGIVSWVSEDEIRAEVARIKRVLADAAEQGPSTELPTGGVVVPAQDPVLNAEAQKLLDNLKKQAETIGLITEEAKTRYAIESGELGELIPEHQELLLTQARQLDQAKANAAASDEQRKATEKLASTQLSFVANLERQASLIGLNTAQTREAEIAEKGLTGALLERAQAASEMLAAEEERLAMEADAKTIAELQTQLLRAQGKESEAVALELEQRYGELMKRLQERADTAGVEIVKALINGEQARTELSSMQKELDRVFNDTSRREQTIQAQVNAGLITEGEARRRIVQEHQKQAKELENLLVLIEGFAEQTGNPAYLEEAERIRAELELLKYTADEVAIAFRDGLQGGLEESIMGLVDGTMSLRDALESLVLGIADSMARMASEQLADMATQRVLDLFNGGAAEQAQAIQQLTTQQVMSIQTVTNAQKTADIARATSSVAAANTAATGQAGAAATTTSAWAPAATTASIGSFGAAAAIGIAAVLAALAMAQSFNTGGQVRGAGTNTSDSIPAWLSDEEFITRAAVVKQPGALSFLEDFNQRGMSALDDWAGTVYHSTGGLAGTPAPAAPSPVFDGGRMSEESALTANVANNFRFAALFDIEEVASRLGSSPGFTDVLIQMTANNATAMQSALTT
jgi:hypothetical protein